MRLRIKTSGFSLTPGLETMVREKLLIPLERRVGSLLPEESLLDVELAKTTKHHEEGKIWKCEVNIPVPHEKRTIYFSVIEESLEAAIDVAKDELERKVGEYKEKKSAKFLRSARMLKERMHIASLARRAKGAFRWFRRK